MTLDLTFLGHSGFLMSDGDHTLAIDPFLTGNPVATMAAGDVKCDAIALTHGHADHFGDTLAIAQANNANVIAAFEMCNYLQEQGHDNVNPGNPGGRIETPFGWVAFTHAFHSSSFEGQYMGMPCGLVVHMGGKTVYHCGDTGLFGDMKLIGEILPAGRRLRADRRPLHDGSGTGDQGGRADRRAGRDPDPLRHLAADRAGPGRLRTSRRRSQGDGGRRYARHLTAGVFSPRSRQS